jgi:hypothetical protein
LPGDATLQSVADEIGLKGLSLQPYPEDGTTEACLRFWSTLSGSQKKRLLNSGLLRKDLTKAQRVEEDRLARMKYPGGTNGNPAVGADRPVPLIWADGERIPLRVSVQLTVDISCIDENGSRTYMTSKRDDLKWCLRQNQSAPDSSSVARLEWYIVWYLPSGGVRHDVGDLRVERELWRGTWKEWLAPSSSLQAIVQPIWDAAAKWEAVRNRWWQEEQAAAKKLPPPKRGARPGLSSVGNDVVLPGKMNS